VVASLFLRKRRSRSLGCEAVQVNTTLPLETRGHLLARLPSDPTGPLAPRWHPIHTVYGGAHLFSAQTPRKLGHLARRALEGYAPDPETLAEAMGMDLETARQVLPRLKSRLEERPIEDYRIDFEDGYGVRSDDEEDRHALGVGQALAIALEEGGLPPRVGIRIRALTRQTGPRALRTLDLVLTRLVSEAGGLPDGFVVTLPKVEDVEAPRILTEALEGLEAASGLPVGSVAVELMVESPKGLAPQQVRAGLEATKGRCLAIHFGANDFLTACGVGPAEQDLGHPLCDFARATLHLGVAGHSVRLVDGTTTVLPVPPHRGVELGQDQLSQNRRAVHEAWLRHAQDIRRGLRQGFHQGWDLHPAQLVSRFAVIQGWFLEGADAVTTRLNNFLEASAQATRVGTVFDDAATGRALLAHFLRGLDCGAWDEKEVRKRTGLSREQLLASSFPDLLAGRLA